MANVKNITELPVAGSAAGLNLIVNDGGAAKQITAERLFERVPIPVAAEVGQVMRVSAVDEHGVPTAWEAYNADEVAKAYTNSQRLAYTEKQTVNVLPETTVSYNPDDGAYFGVATPFADNVVYVVEINGVKFLAQLVDGVLWNFSQLPPTMEFTLNTNTVAYIEVDDGNLGMWVDFVGAVIPETVTIKITTETETIHPIDPKFLPGGGGGMPKIEVHVASLDEACDFTLTPEQVATVKSAATSGMPLVFSVVDDGAGVKVNVFANLTYVQQSDYYSAKGTYEGSTVSIEGVGDTFMGRWEFE